MFFADLSVRSLSGHFAEDIAGTHCYPSGDNGYQENQYPERHTGDSEKKKDSNNFHDDGFALPKYKL
jgi:hypothetical protein